MWCAGKALLNPLRVCVCVRMRQRPSYTLLLSPSQSLLLSFHFSLSCVRLGRSFSAFYISCFPITGPLICLHVVQQWQFCTNYLTIGVCQPGGVFTGERANSEKFRGSFDPSQRRAGAPFVSTPCPAPPADVFPLFLSLPRMWKQQKASSEFLLPVINGWLVWWMAAGRRRQLTCSPHPLSIRLHLKRAAAKKQERSSDE